MSTSTTAAVNAASSSSAQSHTMAPPSQTNGGASGSGSVRAPRQQNRKKGGGGQSHVGAGVASQASSIVDAESVYRLETTASVGAKRTAHDRADAEPRKRKRIDHSAAFQAQQQVALASASASSQTGAKQNSTPALDGDNQPSLVSSNTFVILSCMTSLNILTLIIWEFTADVPICVRSLISRRCQHRRCTGISSITILYRPSIRRR